MVSTRLQALDAFRGLTIFLMVMANTAGDGAHVYPPLRHAEWHGWTITDAIFPSFVWIVGVAITLALGRKLEQNADKGALYKDISRRAVVLFTLGLFLYAFPTFPLETFRILGVLQRIAICYAVASFLFLNVGLRGQLIACGALLVAYGAIMKLIPAPGFAPGDLSVEGNFAHYIDRLILGSHNYVNTKTWDPEGVVSTLPAIASCLLGVLAGHILRMGWHLNDRVQKLVLIGAGLVASGLMLDTWMPINKKLWTVSFTLLMAGIDFIGFGAMMWLIDGKRIVAPFRPAIVMGMNAIAIYLSSEFVIVILETLNWKEPIYHTVFASGGSTEFTSFLFAFAYALLHLGMAYWMYRRNWFLKV